MDETDNGIRGFDAGLYQLLARYILDDETIFELTQINSSTRESVPTRASGLSCGRSVLAATRASTPLLPPRLSLNNQSILFLKGLKTFSP